MPPASLSTLAVIKPGPSTAKTKTMLLRQRRHCITPSPPRADHIPKKLSNDSRTQRRPSRRAGYPPRPRTWATLDAGWLGIQNRSVHGARNVRNRSCAGVLAHRSARGGPILCLQTNPPQRVLVLLSRIVPDALREPSPKIQTGQDMVHLRIVAVPIPHGPYMACRRDARPPRLIRQITTDFGRTLLDI